MWEETCFEIFIGVHDEDFYREINLSPSQAWQTYQFEEYRYPESMPPLVAYDIELNHLKRTHYGLNVSLDLNQFMQQHRLKWANLYLGLTAVLKQKMVCSTMQCSIVENMLIFTINVIGCMSFVTKSEKLISLFINF